MAIQVEIGIAIVRALVAVVGGEANPDVLSMIGTQICTHSGPVLPEDIAAGGVPVQSGIGNIIGGPANRVHKVVVLVKQLKFETRLFRLGMVRVLQHSSILQQQNGGISRIHMEGVCDAFRLRTRRPVAQADRILLTRRQDVEQTARPGIGSLLQIDGVPAGLRLPAVIHNPGILIGIAEGPVLAQDVGTVQAGQINAGNSVRHTYHRGGKGFIGDKMVVAAVEIDVGIVFLPNHQAGDIIAGSRHPDPGAGTRRET